MAGHEVAPFVRVDLATGTRTSPVKRTCPMGMEPVASQTIQGVGCLVELGACTQLFWNISTCYRRASGIESFGVSTCYLEVHCNYADRGQANASGNGEKAAQPFGDFSRV